MICFCAGRVGLEKIPVRIKIFRHARGRDERQQNERGGKNVAMNFHAGLDAQLPAKVTAKQVTQTVDADCRCAAQSLGCFHVR